MEEWGLVVVKTWQFVRTYLQDAYICMWYVLLRHNKRWIFVDEKFRILIESHGLAGLI